MSEGTYTLLGVVIGGLLTPVVHGIGYYFRRKFEKADRCRIERREALIELQAALLDLVTADSPPEKQKSTQEIIIAKRRVRIQAARVGDAELWTLVTTPDPGGVTIGEVTNISPPPPGEPGDRYDAWNQRIQELFQELDDH